MTRTNNPRRLVWWHALLIAWFLALPVLAAPAPQAQSSVELIKNLFTLVSSEFIYETPPSKLANGALDGLKAGLEAKKLAVPNFEQVPAEATRDEAVNAFSRQFYDLARSHPELMKDNWLAYQAIKGMLKILDDHYTVFLTPAEYNNLKEAMSGGNFGGLGVYIELDKSNENWLTVVEPIEDTPAAKAGLKARDIILKVDGKSTRGITVEGAQTMLRGEVGSKVVLTIRRQHQAAPFDVVLHRDRIRVNSVAHKLIERDGVKVGYLKLRMFGDNTNAEMEAAMRELEKEGAQAFLLDLRNNGGGYIVASVDVCSKFLPSGSRVVSVEERGEGETFYQSRPNLREQLPLVLLVNEYSASASEITAGAMQDLNRAKLVGVKTFGKGSVQKIFPLPDGSALKVTTAHYHTPTGKDINKIGIEPDVKIEMPAKQLGTNDDTQLKTALEAVAAEVKARQEISVDRTDFVQIASVDAELDYIKARENEGYTIVSRKLVREENRLFEDLVIRKGSQEQKVRLDLSSFLEH